ncbi:MAG: tRNA threonylcarbamoyladenosine dehydratase [Cardiobacteriaceae bacterium]|nr:tRNA threonylcarbamoyladenosine dehydratase [Cardiobacteriaceae bacterium]
MPTPHARTEIIIGRDNVQYLREKTVLIAGLGGVGGYCAEAVARAGIGHIIILDHDTVSPSNLNRQLLALHSTIGQKKTAVMQARLLDINPELELTVEDRFIRPDSSEAFLSAYSPDMVADCIDSIACKAALIVAAQHRHIPIISAMGAGNRLDVRKVRIRTLNQTSGCPLARELRRALKARGASLHYPVVFSDEPRRQPLPHQPITGAEPGRARAVNGTISYMPALFGMMMAGYIVETLLASKDASFAADKGEK